MHISKLLPYFLLLTLLSAAVSCSNNDGKNKEKTDKPEPPKDSPQAQIPAEGPKAPIINIVDTISPARIVICMKDSAASIERVGMKLGEIYTKKLGEFMAKNKINMAGPPLAWYSSEKAPFFFTAGVPVDKKPAKLPAGAFIKELKSDSALVAHFFGPYDQLSSGYGAIRDWAKSGKIKISAAPFEIYVGDPMDKEGKPVNPYKVQTDIVFTRN